MTLAAAGLSLVGAGSSRADIGAMAPPLPPQPVNGVPPGLTHDCPVSDDRAGRWSVVSEQIAGPQDPPPAYQVAVDPWAPCLLYRADDAQTLDRSSDSGRTWTRIFHDAAEGTYPSQSVAFGNTPPFTASSLVIPRRGAVVLSERANGDAVVSSVDGGHEWMLTNNGISGQPIVAITAAPSDPGTAYAVRTNSLAPAGTNGSTSGGSLSLGAFTIFVTHDGGASWNPAASLSAPPDPQHAALVPDASGDAAGQAPLLAVDPRDAGHLWALVRLQDGAAGVAVVLESTDGGAHWKEAGTIGPGVSFVNSSSVQVTQFLVIRSPDHPLRLFAVGAFTQGSVVQYSDDDGATWFASPLQAYAAPVIAADPADQDRILYAATGAVTFGGTAYSAPQLQYSTDGFSTVQRIQSPRPTGYALVAAPIASAAGSYSPSATLQADREGHFYLGITYQCNGFALPPDCPTQGAQGEAYYRFTPPPPAPSPVSFAPPAGSALPVGPATPQPPSQVAFPLLELTSCPTPVVGNTAGTLTFDMEDLLYTQSNATGPAPLTAVIDRMSPATCADTGVIVVHFSYSDLRTIAMYDGYATRDRPSIETLAYDARRNAVWFTLSSGQGFLFLAPLDSAGSIGPGRVDVTATLRFHAGQGCVPFLSYDATDDSLWTCDGYTSHVRAADGTAIPDDCGVGNVVSPLGPATWVVSAPGHLLIQSEDDQTLYDYDHATCTLDRIYAHRIYSEPLGEDEQEACDPLTFGADSTLPVHSTALWIRDATASTVTAYALPDGSCPLPTVTQYVGQTRADAGGQVTLCATLALQGRNRALANLPLQFLLDGATVDSTRITDVNGLACTNPVAAPSPGTHSVRVDFTGDVSYLPSHDLAALLVTTPGVFAPPRPPVPPAAPPNPPPAPQSAPLPQPAPLSQVQVQAQAQVQTQGQAQSQAQPAGQSVVVTQRQQQAELQLAFAEQRTAVQQAPAPQASSYNMTRLGSADADTAPDPGGVLLGIAGLIGSLGLGIAWALRAPAYATVRRRQRRKGV